LRCRFTSISGFLEQLLCFIQVFGQYRVALQVGDAQIEPRFRKTLLGGLLIELDRDLFIDSPNLPLACMTPRLYCASTHTLSRRFLVPLCSNFGSLATPSPMA